LLLTLGPKKVRKDFAEAEKEMTGVVGNLIVLLTIAIA
jgi:hypothetical protein